MTKIAFAFLILMGGGFADAAIRTEEIDYKHGETTLQGFLAYDHAVKGKRPAVLIVHEWWGHGDYVRERARQLAELGYAAFALDMYGKGVYAKDHEEAAELSGPYREDRTFMRARARAGLDVLLAQPQADVNRVAAIGYCFGGLAAIEMARANFPLAAVVTFHALLAEPTIESAEPIRAAILVNHGADDSHVPQKQIDAFKDEMRRRKADWQLNVYGGAVHSFTVESAGNDPSTGMAYDPAADRRSWAAMERLLNETLKAD